MVLMMAHVAFYRGDLSQESMDNFRHQSFTDSNRAARLLFSAGLDWAST